MLAYVEANIDFVEDYARRNIPGLKVVRPQASFLVWLDFRDLHLCQREIITFFSTKAHLALNDGSMFGRQGERLRAPQRGHPALCAGPRPRKASPTP